MTYETVCSPFFWHCGNILHLNISKYVKKSKFLNLMPFCDVNDAKNDPNMPRLRQNAIKTL